MPVRTATDNQLPFAPRGRSTDQWAGLKDVQSRDDFAQPFRPASGGMHLQMDDDAVEVFSDLGGQLNTRHRYFASFRGRGRAVCRPSMRFSR